MSTGFNAKKAAQVVAYFANQAASKRLNVVKAVKLVYLADRESISRFGFPILDDDRFSMPLGPVNSTTYRFINGELEHKEWSELLQDRENHELSVTTAGASSDLDELSDADIDCLAETWRRFGAMDQWALVDWTHNAKNIPEWEDPNGSSVLIPLQRIMSLLSMENATEHSAVVEDHKKMSRLLAALRN